ncbi:hypothetical protein ACQE3E_06195 [Methylomonas sp. MED-D]|uniref:hypothetical protein n=1 Tax=Methylomonas sp. MED-D TaxID=3418768 RepID=UPI003D090422
MTLYEHFCAALNESRDVAANGYLQLLAPFIKDIESASSADSALAEYCRKMVALVQKHHFVLNGDLVSEFSQLFGEAHFASLCRERGVSLVKIQELQNKKTPDFLHSSDQQNVYFEVKTLSVVNGGRGINKDLLNALDAQIDIEQQQKKGKTVAIGTSEMQPYAEKPYREGAITAVISTLIEKARQNIKSDQYSNPNTFLVLNLCLISPAITDNRTLRPAYCDDYLFPKAITGDLWMLAFAKPGMLVLGCPEFEGKPCIEGVIQKLGILADEEFANISGLLVVVYPLGEKPSIYGLYRGADHDKWVDEGASFSGVLESLTNQNWNDDTDSNGWQLGGRESNAQPNAPRDAPPKIP